MQGFGDKKNSKKRKIGNQSKKIDNDELIKRAFQLQAQGKKFEAAKYYSYLIKNGLKDCRIFSNYGIFLKEIGRYQQAELELAKAIKINPKYANAFFNLGVLFLEKGNLLQAELNLRKAIDLKSDFASAYYNLGFILKNIGKLQEAEIYIKKAIEKDSHLTDAYLSLSTMQESVKDENWKNKLFSESILNNKDYRGVINILFARSNILHKNKQYKESAKNLIRANNLKLKLYKSEANLLIKKTSKLKISSNNFKRNFQEQTNDPISIFIVGMPRCGSTLVESIISLNSQVNDLGEVNIFEESYRKYMQSDKTESIGDIYKKNSQNNNVKLTMTTNKWLFNYQYAGIIASTIPNAKIIHCYRNPLDNILSIYRAHFRIGNSFSSSLVDSARVYSDQEEIMNIYKKEFGTYIYDLNYDKLVTNPLEEIKSLINWLEWEWNDIYLSPHLNKRSVFTRSNVEIRSPINSKSVGGWKNYQEMLKPAIEILSKKDNSKNLIT